MTDTGHIPCLSLWQPWASLMAFGAKRVETRGYPPPIGRPRQFLIHAAKHWEKKTKAICDAPYFREALDAAGYASWRDLPTGAIVAATTLVFAARVDRRPREVEAVYFGRVPFPPPEPERAFGDYAPGRWGWFTADLRRLSTPLPWVGKQGIFYVPGAAVAPYLSGRPVVAPRRVGNLFGPA